MNDAVKVAMIKWLVPTAVGCQRRQRLFKERVIHRTLTILLTLMLAACASYGGKGLIVGDSGLDEVIHVMGEPRMQWTESDGTRHLVYPRGPLGAHTYMVRIGIDGKLQSIENVLEPRVFMRIEAGMSKDQVLRVLGPPEPSWTAYFKARDELVWEWRYCDDWSELERFDVLFDGTKEVVRSTMSIIEECGWGHCQCSR